MAADRDADVLQHLVIDVPEQVHADFISLKGVAILGKAYCLQPFLDLAHALNCSSNALASFKSRVSKPSVNQA
jgi:hypothetical protein